MSKPRFASALLLSLVSASASAQNVVATGYATAPPGPREIDGRIGLLLGGADVGDAQGFSAGVSAAVGYRMGSVTLRGLLDYYKVGDGGDVATPRRGRAARIGAAVRTSFASNADDSSFGVDFWGELGAGYEHVYWLHGGVLDRPSAEAAFGLDLGARGERDAHGHRREIGYFMDFRTLVGEAPEQPGAMATCAGPCTRATTPPRTDVTMFFELGVHWGR